MFGSVVTVAFQSAFHSKMHQNDVFLFFKKLFLRYTHQNDSKYTKKINF
jgi:hypothetical protein